MSLTLPTIRERFFHAARYGDNDTLVKLIALQPRLVDAIDEVGRNALHQTARNGNTHSLDLLVQYGIYLSNESIHGISIAHQAAYSGHLEFLQRYYEMGGDITATDEDSHTPRDIALKENQQHIIDYIDELMWTEQEKEKARKRQLNQLKPPKGSKESSPIPIIINEYEATYAPIMKNIYTKRKRIDAAMYVITELHKLHRLENTVWWKRKRESRNHMRKKPISEQISLLCYQQNLPNMPIYCELVDRTTDHSDRRKQVNKRKEGRKRKETEETEKKQEAKEVKDSKKLRKVQRKKGRKRRQQTMKTNESNAKRHKLTGKKKNGTAYVSLSNLRPFPPAVFSSVVSTSASTETAHKMEKSTSVSAAFLSNQKHPIQAIENKIKTMNQNVSLMDSSTHLLDPLNVSSAEVSMTMPIKNIKKERKVKIKKIDIQTKTVVTNKREIDSVVESKADIGMKGETNNDRVTEKDMETEKEEKGEKEKEQKLIITESESDNAISEKITQKETAHKEKLCTEETFERIPKTSNRDAVCLSRNVSLTCPEIIRPENTPPENTYSEKTRHENDDEIVLVSSVVSRSLCPAKECLFPWKEMLLT